MTKDNTSFELSMTMHQHRSSKVSYHVTPLLVVTVASEHTCARKHPRRRVKLCKSRSFCRSTFARLNFGSVLDPDTQLSSCVCAVQEPSKQKVTLVVCDDLTSKCSSGYSTRQNSPSRPNTKIGNQVNRKTDNQRFTHLWLSTRTPLDFVFHLVCSPKLVHEMSEFAAAEAKHMLSYVKGSANVLLRLTPTVGDVNITCSAGATCRKRQSQLRVRVAWRRLAHLPLCRVYARQSLRRPMMTLYGKRFTRASEYGGSSS